jgi:O-antigen/teichoic acid export membrane protein
VQQQEALDSQPSVHADSPSPARRLSLRALFHTRGVWALTDQACASLGNCLTGIAVAATFSAYDLGTFALMFGMLLFVNSLHTSLVTYPMSVRGAPAGDRTLRILGGEAVLLTLSFAPLLCLGVVTMALVQHQARLIPWAVAAMVLWQLQETMRRGMMAHLRHREAVVGDAVSYLGQAGVMWFLHSRGSLTLQTAFATMAFTSMLGVLIQAIQLRPILRISRKLTELFRESWWHGRWLLMTNVIAIFTVQATPWTLDFFYGNVEVAHYAVLAQVLGVSNPIVISIAGLIVPAVASASSRDGIGAAKRIALSYGAQGAVLLIPYYAIILLVPGFAISIFSKGNPEYAGLENHLRLFAIGYFFVFPGHVMQALLNGLGHTRAAFNAQLVFSGGVVILGLPLVAWLGLKGAVVAGMLPTVAYVITSALMLHRTNDARKPAKRDDDETVLGAAIAPAPGGAAA